MKKNTNGYHKIMVATEEMKRAVAGAYDTENTYMASDDWRAVQDIFGANDNAMERYAEGMIDGNICYRI